MRHVESSEVMSLANLAFPSLTSPPTLAPLLGTGFMTNALLPSSGDLGSQPALVLKTKNEMNDERYNCDIFQSLDMNATSYKTTCNHSFIPKFTDN